MSKPLLSLCLPTNGVIEWVFPVLDSIYNQKCASDLFEVVVTDNGDNVAFKERMHQYVDTHSNIVYEETNAFSFLNEIEAYKRASGELIKFVNHRTLLVEGALERLIDFTRENAQTKPIVYFSNGVLPIPKSKHEYGTFDEFVRNLSYFSSWSTGMTFWKSDFEKLSTDVGSYNELFPHANVLFAERTREKYVIDNSVIFFEMPQGNKPKGRYDLFYAFGVEYPGIILDLYRNKDISCQTFKKVTEDNLGFVADLYIMYIVQKKYSSYDLGGIHDMCGVFYSKSQLLCKVVTAGFRKIRNKLRRIFWRLYAHCNSVS